MCTQYLHVDACRAWAAGTNAIHAGTLPRLNAAAPGRHAPSCSVLFHLCYKLRCDPPAEAIQEARRASQRRNPGSSRGPAMICWHVQVHARRLAGARELHRGARAKRTDLEIAPPPFCRHAPKERKRLIFQTQRAKRTRFFPMSNTPCGTRARNLRIRGPTPCPLGQGGSAHLAQLFASPPLPRAPFFRYARAGAPPAVCLPRRSMATSARLKK